MVRIFNLRVENFFKRSIIQIQKLKLDKLEKKKKKKTNVSFALSCYGLEGRLGFSLQRGRELVKATHPHFV